MNLNSENQNHLFESIKEKILTLPEQPDIPENLWEDFLTLRRKLQIFERAGFRVFPSLKPILKFLPQNTDQVQILVPFCDFSFLPFLLAHSGYNFIASSENCNTIYSIRNSMEILHIPFSGNYICTQATNLPFPNEKFDYIICNYLTQKFPDPWDILIELQRVIKNEGKIILRDFNRKGMKLLQEIRRSEGFSPNIKRVSVFEVAEFFDKQDMDVTCQRDELHATLVITNPGSE